MPSVKLFEPIQPSFVFLSVFSRSYRQSIYPYNAAYRLLPFFILLPTNRCWLYIRVTPQALGLFRHYQTAPGCYTVKSTNIAITLNLITL